MKFDRALPVMGDIEFRAAGDGNTFVGYAALFDSPSDARAPFQESIAPGAFKRSLASGGYRAFVLNHDENLPLASTKTGRLRLAEDQRGLRVEADLPHTSYAEDLRNLHLVGETLGMSFTFKAAKNGQVIDGNSRRLTDVQLGHVTVLTNQEPWYPATAATMQIRSLAKDLSADVDDLETLLDAIHEGRALADDEAALLTRLAAHYAPAPILEVQSAEPASGRSLVTWTALLTEKGILTPN